MLQTCTGSPPAGCHSTLTISKFCCSVRCAFLARTLLRRFSEHLSAEDFMAVHPVVVHDPVCAPQ